MMIYLILLRTELITNKHLMKVEEDSECNNCYKFNNKFPIRYINNKIIINNKYYIKRRIWFKWADWITKTYSFDQLSFWIITRRTIIETLIRIRSIRTVASIRDSGIERQIRKIKYNHIINPKALPKTYSLIIIVIINQCSYYYY